jgi:hypothetical protein
LVTNNTTTFSGTTSVSGTNTFTVGTGTTTLGGALGVSGIATFDNDSVFNAHVSLGNSSVDNITQNGNLILAAASKLQVGASTQSNSILMTDNGSNTPVLRNFISTDGSIVFTMNTSVNGAGTIDIETSGTIPGATSFEDIVTFQDTVNLGNLNTDRVVFTSYVDGPLHMGTTSGGGWFVDQYPFSSAAAVASNAVASLSASTYRSVEYFIQATSGTMYYTTKLLVIHDGTTASVTEYGTMKVGAWGTFDFTAEISVGNLVLSYNNAPVGPTTTVRVLATAFKA